MQHLFSEYFLASIAQLSMDVRSAPPRAAQGMHLSPRPGSSLEFRDYQPYSPGDDLRRVDWAVYGKTRQLFVRRFDRPTAVPVFMLVDCSASMHLETPSRYATAAQLAAAVASAAVAANNPVRLTIADGQAGPMPRAIRDRRSLMCMLADLSADHPPQGPGPAASLSTILPLLAAQPRGVLVVISDFFESSGIDAIVNILKLIHQRLVLLCITQPHDIDPVIDDDVELEDCESAAHMQISASPELLTRYREAYRNYFKVLEDYAAVRGATLMSFDASSETLPQLEGLFPSGVLNL